MAALAAWMDPGNSRYLELLVTNMTSKQFPTGVNFMMHIEFSRHTHDTRMAFRQCEFY